LHRLRIYGVSPPRVSHALWLLLHAHTENFTFILTHFLLYKIPTGIVSSLSV
jgi:hypothetical protein